MILNIWSIYFEYLDQDNKANKERHEIYTHMLGLKQELHIVNEEKKDIVSLL